MRYGNVIRGRHKHWSLFDWGVPKTISSRTCNAAVRWDRGLDTLKSRRDKAKLKQGYKVSISA